MRILVVAATSDEVAPLLGTLQAGESAVHRIRNGRLGRHDVDVLVSGVGMVATAVWCAAALVRRPYDCAINAGLCGAFDRSLTPGTVVHVVSDRLSELGAEDGDAFLTIHELGLLGRDEPPFRGGVLVNHAPPDNAALGQLRTVGGITVNAVHGRDGTIADVAARFNPQIESMEGAAFMYACAVHDVPYAQIRAISNLVERRNRAAWQIAPAVRALNATVVAFLESA
jgi:futalosine hydrolase